MVELNVKKSNVATLIPYDRVQHALKLMINTHILCVNVLVYRTTLTGLVKQKAIKCYLTYKHQVQSNHEKSYLEYLKYSSSKANPVIIN